MIPIHRNIAYIKTSMRELKTLKIAIMFSIISIIGSIYWMQLQNTNSEDIEFLRTRLSDFNKKMEEIKKYNSTEQIQHIENLIQKIENIPEPVTNKKINDIKKLYDKAERYIERMQKYFHDQTGRPDLALESAGARIMSVGDTKLLYQGGLRTWILRSMGFIERSITNSPRFAIQSSMELGNCFCFHGQKGLIVIGLAKKTLIDSLTLQHISSQMSPTGNINNAPKDISLWGMKSLDSPTNERHHYGNFTFDINENESFQTFTITKLGSESFKLVQLNFHSNHGNHNTCVYKIRLHGVVNE